MLTSKKARALSSFFCTKDAAGFRISGHSMYPYLKAGEQVHISSSDHITLKPGRCYAFVHANKFILHRLLSVTGSRALFMGDNMIVPHFIQTDKIIGELKIENSAPADSLIETVSGIFKKCPRIRRRLIRIIILLLNKRRKRV